VIDSVLPEDLASEGMRVFVNPTGRFELGGPNADTGLTGRKIIVDTYGGMARHGGGAFSGKDPTKVDRSAAYAVRWVAKNVVAAGLAERCEVQVAYAIGVAHPVSVFVETFGTEQVDPGEAGQAAARSSSTCARRRSSATSTCAGPIYKKTAAYGHFGRSEPEFTWESTIRADELPRRPVPCNHHRNRGREPGLDLDVRLAGVQVLVDVPLFHLDRPFTYRVPESLQDQVHLGTRVKVPFGGRRRVDGWVVGRSVELPPDARDVLRVVSPHPLVRPRRLELFRWVADRYAAAVRHPRPGHPAAGRRGARRRGQPADPVEGAPAHVRPASTLGPPPDGPLRRSGRPAAGRPGGLWRPLPGEDRGARGSPLVEAALAGGGGRSW
jgi:hypothetical protein